MSHDTPVNYGGFALPAYDYSAADARADAADLRNSAEAADEFELTTQPTALPRTPCESLSLAAGGEPAVSFEESWRLHVEWSRHNFSEVE